MLSLIKVLFIIVAGIFIITLLKSQDFSLNLVPYSVYDGPAPRDLYIASYDSNSDGTISDKEYRLGEIARIEEELEELEEEVAKALLANNASEYQDAIDLRIGDVKTSDEDEENLELMNWGNTSIDISGWTLKGILSGRSIRIRDGMRRISLRSGETAYLYSGDGNTERENNQWLIYFDRNDDLWRREREAIVLYDNAGKVVDLLRY